MSRASIDMSYAGTALDGTMDVRELAPALLAMGSLLEDANLLLNGDTSKVKVLVKSDFRTGSFELGLEVIQSIVDATKTLFDLHNHVGAGKLLEYLGFGVGGTTGLVKLIKWLRGREIKNITAIDTGHVRIVTQGDHDTIEVIKAVAELHQDRAVRNNIEAVVKPLDYPGIESVTFKKGDAHIETVEKSERPYFVVPEVELRELIDNTFEAAYHIVSVAFEDEIKWRLFDGTNRIAASMRDSAFLDEMNDGVLSFTKGDVIKAKMRRHQWTGPEGLKNEYEVVEVIEHIRATRSIQLPLPEPDE